MTLLAPALMTIQWCILPLLTATLLVLLLGVLLRGGRPIVMMPGGRGLSLPGQYMRNLPGHIREHCVTVMLHGVLGLFTCTMLLLVLYVTYAKVSQLYRPLTMLESCITLLGTYECLGILIACGMGLWQVYRFRRSLYLSYQEYKDDLKANEGNQTIKQVRREQHRELQQREWCAVLERASVVVLERQD